MDIELRIRAPHEISIEPDPDDLRRRMGTYVRQLLEGHAQLQVPGWHLEAGWDDRRLWATLTRGELVLEADVCVREWWSPPSRRVAEQWAVRIGRLLWKLQLQFAAADEAGWIHLQGWVGDRNRFAWEPKEGLRPVAVTLAPGVKPSTVNGGSMVNFWRLHRHTTLHLQDAIAEGWVVLQGGRST